MLNDFVRFTGLGLERYRIVVVDCIFNGFTVAGYLRKIHVVVIFGRVNATLTGTGYWGIVYFNSCIVIISLFSEISKKHQVYM